VHPCRVTSLCLLQRATACRNRCRHALPGGAAGKATRCPHPRSRPPRTSRSLHIRRHFPPGADARMCFVGSWASSAPQSLASARPESGSDWTYPAGDPRCGAAEGAETGGDAGNGPLGGRSRVMPRVSLGPMQPVTHRSVCSGVASSASSRDDGRTHVELIRRARCAGCLPQSTNSIGAPAQGRDDPCWGGYATCGSRASQGWRKPRWYRSQPRRWPAPTKRLIASVPERPDPYHTQPSRGGSGTPLPPLGFCRLPAPRRISWQQLDSF
jgi:hypothetical protein